MPVLKCNEKSAVPADLRWLCQGSHSCLMASLQALPFLSLPSKIWDSFPLPLTVIRESHSFPSWCYLNSDHNLLVTVSLTLVTTLATEQTVVLSSSMNRAFPVLSVASCDNTGAIISSLTLKEHKAKKHGRQVVSRHPLPLAICEQEKDP